MIYKKNENHDMIFNVFRVISAILTNDKKKLKKIEKTLYIISS